MLNGIQLTAYQISGIIFMLLTPILLIWGGANTISNSFLPEKRKVMIARSSLLGIYVVLGIIAGLLVRRTTIIVIIAVLILTALGLNISGYFYQAK